MRITEFSEHESNGRELDEGSLRLRFSQSFQSAAAVEPGDGAFEPGLDDEASRIACDLGLEIGQDAGQKTGPW